MIMQLLCAIDTFQVQTDDLVLGVEENAPARVAVPGGLAVHKVAIANVRDHRTRHR
jgi:hypothetical protein